MAGTADSTVRPEVLDLLQQLRTRIRRYVALEGAALVVAVLGGAFWFSLGTDYWLELSVTARGALLALALGTTGAAFLWFLLLRVIRTFRNRALALVLERRFPQLNDRLITAVELSESREETTPLTAAMLQQTAEEAASLSRQLQLREVFNTAPLLKSTLLASGLLVSIVVFGWGASDVFGTWFRRNLLLSDEYYRRETDLTVVVLAEPGERTVEFHDGVYKHPRGADLTFLATVPDGKRVPEQVQFTYRNIEHSGGGGDFMTRIGQRQFRHRLAGLHDSVRLWLSGGDYTTRTPLVVEVVDPPQIDRLTLHAMYPEYTGLNLPGDQASGTVRQDVPVLGAQVSLPTGTDFVLEARANKPLVDVLVQTDAWELRVSGAKVQFTPLASGAAAAKTFDLPVAPPLLGDDGLTFRVPCVLAPTPNPELVSEEGRVYLPLRLAPDTLLRMTLHDLDDVMSIEPARLTVNAIADEPPQVETRLKGIGTSITRQATIPIVGEIQDPQDGSKRYGATDDYGVAEARFEYKVEGSKGEKGEGEDAAFKAVPFSVAAEGRKQVPVEEKFPVLPLDLAIGVKLTLKVVAVDADNLTGPHSTAGRPWSFQIVSDDELVALIAVKELNLRRRFEQILEEVRNTRKDLLLARTRVEEVRAGTKAARPGEAAGSTSPTDAAALAVERAINGVRKNANETLSIEEEFRDIRDEIENNAIPDARPMLERIDDGILRPLHSINTVDYNTVDEALLVLRRALEDRGDALAGFTDPIEGLNSTIEHMEAVLAQMLKLETVNEALQLLRDIIKSQEQLQDKTRQERKKKLIEGLQ